ncbi:MAG: hypothetical protein JSV24_06350, partial [Bacteroidales bacterium]
QDPAAGDLIAEHDGGTDPVTTLPYTIPVIHNGTFIGRGPGKLRSLVTFRNNAGGKYMNSIFIQQDFGIAIEHTDSPQDSYKQFDLGNLELKNNIFYAVQENIADSIFRVFRDGELDISEQMNAFRSYFTEGANVVSDPEIGIGTDSYDVIPRGDITSSLA